MAGHRDFVLAVDASQLAHKAAKWCVDSLARPGDVLHLLVCTTAPSFGGSITPLAAADAAHKGGREAVAHTKAVHEVLHLANGKVSQEQFRVAPVRAAPGSKGVAKAIMAYARLHNAQLIVLGSRGMNDATSSLMSLVGLGSVSSLCIQGAPCPVALVRGKDMDTRRAKVERRVLLLVEGTTTRDALEWTLDNALAPADHLHMFCIGRPTHKLAEIAGRRLPQEQIHVAEGPSPQEPPAQLCEAVVAYARDQHISFAVLGGWQERRGMAAALQLLLGRPAGLEDMLLRQLVCPVIVLRGDVASGDTL